MTQSAEAHRWYLECVTASSNKFYRLTVEGGTLTAHWGRIGTAGSMQVKTFPNHSIACVEATRKLREKYGKGYLDVPDPLAPHSRSGARAAAESATPESRRHHRSRPADVEPPLRKEEKVQGSANIVMFF